MIIQPKVKGFLCSTAHPLGCEENVRRQINYVKSLNSDFAAVPPKKVLIVGCSTGYGLSARIAAAFGYGAATLGVCREKAPSENRTASPGWYNSKAFDKLASAEGLRSKTLNEDAFLTSTKNKAIEIIKEELGEIDMVIYSLAAPKRAMDDGTVYRSSLKTTGKPFISKDLNLETLEIVEGRMECATEKEIADSVKVMGGEDWYNWISMLSEAGVLKENAVTVAFSYLGPELTYPIYSHGTMGFAKKHLYETSFKITEDFSSLNIKAYVSMNKSMITQASIAIPLGPIYIAIAKKVMQSSGCYENCIQQMYRLLTEKMPPGKPPVVDKDNIIRLDDYELQPEIQEKISRNMERITTETAEELAGLSDYWLDFYNMFGFRFDNIDYSVDVSPFYE
ncbi:MAG: trans-2-enoyl-CoA reductase family protein [Bacillota bacterium]|nr:trans-2-enoyl-CoA reductase family protein [Bacillota bacterium]